MKSIKNMIILIVVAIITIEVFIGAVPSCFALKSNTGWNSNGKPIRVSVVFYRFDDPFVSLVKQSFENIQSKNSDIVSFNFYDSKNEQAVQNHTIDMLLESGNTDLLVLSLVELKHDPKEIINKVKEKNIPVIFVNRRPIKISSSVIESYDKAYYIFTDSEQGGRLQGKILVDMWNKNKDTIDKNKDNIMQYVMLQGDPDNMETIDRTKYSIMAIEDAGIKVENIATKVCNWEEDTAKDTMVALFTQYSNKIEVIVSNNDAMALGAIETLQKFGYNKGDKTKTIPVVGVDAILKAQDFIKKGFMAATIVQSPDIMAETIYDIGIQLLSGNTRYECPKYRCDESGRIIYLPFYQCVC
ncbi:galactose ABC transporter substrate-binding protein [Clostridium chromiireducens]|uniref:D-galactose/methyl-galactoside binding periplasmic protein MglB n=1 Tax=Clostridium chromiireducens TaxID=225345 RepID=A0A1V4IVE6_9CLOT|nr:galactose ABC transporter substrate-binding protein [Clostridium chromiireducens]OPJ63873.1 D-galactose-binding periplasmic protein precursor [Clostridium chromiireducens]